MVVDDIDLGLDLIDDKNDLFLSELGNILNDDKSEHISPANRNENSLKRQKELLLESGKKSSSHRHPSSRKNKVSNEKLDKNQ